jgi:beta-glucosidase-like glycosyl hydrolase
MKPTIKSKKQRWNVHQKIFLILVILVLFLATLNVAKALGWLIPEQPEIKVEQKTIVLSSLTLEQKIAQMIVVPGQEWSVEPWRKMGLGGIHIYAMKDEQLFRNMIAKFQQNMTIPFMVTTDLEGCWTPFGNFKNFTSVSEISTAEKALEVGTEEGEFLSGLGFTLNFAPVVDLNDEIWNCRSFPGDEKEITELAEAYIDGIQSTGIAATAKHYPGKTLVVKDPHKFVVAAEISAADVYPFASISTRDKVKAIMVSHIIASGAVDTKGKPAVVSEAVIGEFKQNYSGLIISDEINMLGLKKYYSTMDEMYIAVFAAGNDLILNFNDDPNEIYHMIQVVKKAVEEGKVSEEQIDSSVNKILELKGFTIV